MKAYCILWVGLFISQFLPWHGKAQNWYKGNMHTHSLWSDGDEFPEIIAEWYKSNRYNFLAITDHNRLQEGDNWRTVPGGFLTQEVYKKYVDKFGEKYVQSKQEKDVLKVRLRRLAEYRSAYEEEGKFLLI